MGRCYLRQPERHQRFAVFVGSHCVSMCQR
jgi:hypothetical protein